MISVIALICVCGSDRPIFGVNRAYAEAVDCSMCHPDLDKKKTVHAAVGMGCSACHTSLNVSDVPHKVTGKVPKGLSSAQPDICYGCHDKTKFSKKNVHAALMMGCTTCHNPHSTDAQKLLIAEMPGLCFNCHDKKKFDGKTIHPPVMGGMCTSCHNPHSSDSPKLLIAEAPDLCFNCHDKAIFAKKNVHAPVMGGMCLSCHSPHATEEMALLPKRPMAVCLDCHPNIAKGPHVVAGARHPLGSLKKPEKPDEKKPGKKIKAPLMDPVRTGKEFYCGSCHDPHSSDFMRMFRYKSDSPFELCINCHKN
ncbi:MAG: hypothetical protein HZB31_05900 [Nitrospirae bacterium]|nr:hypothetical protein [Nitrospirota bacterium]